MREVGDVDRRLAPLEPDTAALRGRIRDDSRPPPALQRLLLLRKGHPMIHPDSLVPARHRDRLRGARARQRARGRGPADRPPRRSASPTSTRRRTSSRRPSRRCATATRTTAPRPASRSCARRAPTDLSRTRGLAIDPARVLRHARRQAVPVLRRARDLRPGRRGDLPEPRLPDLRVGDPLGRRDARAAAAHRGARLRVHGRRPRRAPDAAHEARDPQLAGQPDRRRRRRAS